MPEAKEDASRKLLLKAQRRYRIQVEASEGDDRDIEGMAKGMDFAVGDPAYRNWQYVENPSGGAVVRNGRVDGAFAGHYAVIPQRFLIAGQPVLGSLSVNTMTHPDHRGKGIFMVLAEAVFEDCRQRSIPFSLGFPNPNSHKGFVRHLLFKEIGNVPLWILPLNVRVLLESRDLPLKPLVRALSPVAGGLWGLWRRLVGRGKEGSGGLTISMTQEASARFDALWDEVKAQFANVTVRDRAFLEWRFLRHPTRQYTLWTAEKDGKLAGYLVGRVSTIANAKSGLIVDLLVHDSGAGAEVASQLIAAATRWFEDQGAAMVGCLMLPRFHAARGLKKNGFFVCPAFLLPQPFPAVLRWHAQTPPAAGVLGISTWYLTMGDYDAV